jgi:hypothetical protein
MTGESKKSLAIRTLYLIPNGSHIPPFILATTFLCMITTLSSQRVSPNVDTCRITASNSGLSLFIFFATSLKFHLERRYEKVFPNVYIDITIGVKPHQQFLSSERVNRLLTLHNHSTEYPSNRYSSFQCQRL